jgi:hypothetical protein
LNGEERHLTQIALDHIDFAFRHRKKAVDDQIKKYRHTIFICELKPWHRKSPKTGEKENAYKLMFRRAMPLEIIQAKKFQTIEVLDRLIEPSFKLDLDGIKLYRPTGITIPEISLESILAKGTKQ